MNDEAKNEPHNFMTFLRDATKYWPGTSNVMTKAGTTGSSAMLGHEELLHLIKYCHNEAKKESTVHTTIRQRTMELLGKKIQKWYPFDGNLPGLRKMRGYESIEPNENFDDRSKEAYARLVGDSQNLTKDELRKIVDNSVKPYRESDPSSGSFMGYGWEYSPYHVAVVFDKSVITAQNSYDHKAWCYLHASADGGSLLGAISLIPNRTLVEEMRSLSLHSAEWAHPVFNASGNLCFPGLKTNEIN